MKKIISLLLVFSIFISLSGESWAQYYNRKKRRLSPQEKKYQEEADLIARRERNPYKIGLMSLLPGMGQFYNKKKAKGFVMLGSCVASLITIFIFHLKYDDAYKKYNALGPGRDPEEYTKWYNEANDNYITRNTLFLVTFAIIGVSMLDAFLDAKEINRRNLAKIKEEREEAKRMKLTTKKPEPKDKTTSSRYEEYKKIFMEKEDYPYMEKSKYKEGFPSPHSDPYYGIQYGYSILGERLKSEDLKKPCPSWVKEKPGEVEELEKSYVPYFQKEHFEYESGTVVSSIQIPTSSPSGLTFDGTNLWYSDFIERKIYKIDPITGLQKYSFSSCGKYPTGLAFDGTYLWNADKKEYRIYKINRDTGLVVSEIPAPSRWIGGLTYDGEALWCCDEVTNTIYRVDPENGTVLHQIPTPENETYGVAWDGEYLWCLDYNQDFIYKIEPEDGKIVSAYSAPTSQGKGIVFDGFYLWVLGADEKRIFRIVP